MLNFSTGSNSDCQQVSRRSFLQIGGLAGLGISIPTLLAGRQAAAAARATSGSPSAAAGRDVNCILVWTQGGTSHHDTFDPKPEAPLNIRGEFQTISTAVPGVQFTEIMPNMARELKRFAVLRSWNPQNGSHGIADQYVMSGRRFNPALTYPTMGAVVSWNKGFKTAMPPFLQLGTSIDRRFGGGSSGILGLSHNPFELNGDPNSPRFTVRDISLPKGVTTKRLSRRQKMLSKIDALQQRADLQPSDFEALDEHYKAALNMITAPETKKAFDLASEKDSLRDQYGRNKFGQSCLLARRLLQAGVRFVTVTDGGWDTHANNFRSLKTSRIPPVDRGLPALLADLEDHGMLDSTLVVWLTDFGRTPKINSASGRDHWASAGFAFMAGAGVPGGYILGETDDEGGRPIRNEYLTEDIVATVYSKLGIPLDVDTVAADGRPIRLLEGRPIREWM